MNFLKKLSGRSDRSRASALFAVAAFLLVLSSSACANAQQEATKTEETKTTNKTQLSQSEKALKTRQYTEMMRSVFTFVEQNYVDEVDPTVLYEGAMKGIMDALGDPYTVYLDTSQMRSMTDTTVGNFGGVGLSISKAPVSTPEKPAYVEVVSPIENTPGWKAGIQAGDLILSIDGTNTADITMDEVLALLRGEVGKSVKVHMKRGKNMEYDVTLVRAIIEVPTVKYEMIGSDIGYLRIIEFTPQTPERVQEALDSFAKSGYKSLIIDLRNNPGGLITSVVSVADKFIDSGTIVSTKSRLQSENMSFTAKKANTTAPRNMPIVVLINKGSASASEILSGALKDDHLAYLVGENTYGKGSVQQVIPLNLNNDGIKLTTARYYTPSDSNIDKVGIPPDREVLFPVLSEEEEKTYLKIFQSDEISKYVEAHPNMTQADIAAYAKTLKKTYNLEERVLRKLVSNEVYRTKTQPLYDLDFDIQLVAAIDILRKESFPSLMRKTKTISELQQEAKQKAEKEKKAEKKN
ncbi:MAG: S41 family peptidase [Spirochaetaceae bacterium]|nr:S41 family peptidase [Spirochaetaceae bacterium]MBO4727701.1 S41 family peptidase [Spirochaetaceae bacterium]MBR4823231.1 S41 family peptidase [Spirochaetaceae bacterium]